MSIIDDYKQLRMIENIKNFKEMEIAYKANLKLCKYQEQQINKLATCIEEIKEVLQLYNNTTIGTDKGNGIFEFEVSNDNVLGGKLICCYDTNPAKKALQKISEVIDE